MKDFAAIDFETANNQRSSVCSVGIVVVRNDEIVDTFIHSSIRNRIIIPTGAHRYTGSPVKTPKTHQCFLMYGSRSNP